MDPLLCDPLTKQPLTVDGDCLVGSRRYPVVDGIPRFITLDQKTVHSFGDEWNRFDFAAFKAGWLSHIVANTFGTTDVFKGKVVVDAGAGSGAHSRWIAEAGAKKVYALELSHSVDGVMRRNLDGLSNVQVIQCSIDQVPLIDECIDMVYCINVIQHTPSVENTARELFRLVKPGGELVFNCYNETGWGTGWKRAVRRAVERVARPALSRLPYPVLLAYSYLMSALRFVPGLGWMLEASMLMSRGEVIEPSWRSRFRQGALNTFDRYGSHAYQHVKTEAELRELVAALQPDSAKRLNVDRMFADPPPVGCAFRIFR